MSKHEERKDFAAIYSSEENERTIMILTAVVLTDISHSEPLATAVEKSMDVAEYIFAAVKQRRSMNRRNQS